MPIHRMAGDRPKRRPTSNRRRRLLSPLRPNPARRSTILVDRPVLGQNRLQFRPEPATARLRNRRLRRQTRLQGADRNPAGDPGRNRPPRRQIEAQLLRHQPRRRIQPPDFSQFEAADFPQMRDRRLRQESERDLPR